MSPENRFNQIYKDNYTKVFRLCLGYFSGDLALAQDSAQEVFVKVWEHLPGFREDALVSTWVYRIAVNTCLLYLRKPSTKKETRLLHIPEKQEDAYDTKTEEQLQKMYGCINQLDEKSKLITLMLLEGTAYNEIAEVIGISEENLRVKIHRIKKNLTNCVQHGNV